MTTDGVSPPGNVSERGLLYKNPVGSVSGLVRTSVCLNPDAVTPPSISISAMVADKNSMILTNNS